MSLDDQEFPMLQTIINAIANKAVISFDYSHLPRVVEPHAVGISLAGNPVLRCYQTHGRHIAPGHDWNLCELSKISNLKVTSDTFPQPRPGYVRGDKGMRRIDAQL